MGLKCGICKTHIDDMEQARQHLRKCRSSGSPASYGADQRIPKLAALILQSRDWHKLNIDERRLASLLRERGYLKKSGMGGYTGPAA